MLRKKFSLMAVLAGSMLFAGTLLADSMRCGTHLIGEDQRSGGGKYEVLKKCGEPKARMGNTWVYEKEGRTREVRFNDSGRVISIK
jgi:hypothetical protein